MVLFLSVYCIYVIYRSVEAMHMLQQNLYNENNRYMKWIKKNYKRVFTIIDFLPIVLFLLLYFIDDKGILDLVLIGSMFIYLFGIILEYRRNKDNQNKLPLKATGRIKRLFVTYMLIYGVAVYFTIVTKNMNILPLLLILLSILLGFVYFVVQIGNILDTPLNKLVYFYYFNKAKKKLKEYSNLKVIGITGSYGKTSSKNILNEILSSKYITRPTPKNFNTPYGLMMTINNYLDKFDEILIAEMGAYINGKIKKLCDFVHPKYGILTRIGVAHLDSFKTEENIIKTKFELIESLPSDGIGVLNADDPKQVSYSIKNDCRIVWVGIDNDCDYRAFDIKYTYKGMSFKVNIDGKNYEFSSSLIGRANIYNILAGIALSHELGMDINDIQRGVRSIKPIEHRLQMKKMGNINIIDDAYNSNPVGSSMAVEALSLMPGEKVIVTPGMIELKDKEYDYNYQFGVEISKVCDKVILVGHKQTKAIQDALKDNGYKESNLYVIDDVKEAFNIVGRDCRDGAYVLLENDLPDIFNE